MNVVKKCCDGCINQINENEELEANLKLIKRQTPNEFGHMFPHYKE